MCTPLCKKQNNNQGNHGAGNIVLYNSNTPVITVEQGTTFGLTKMLYESLGLPGLIIGLRQRSSNTLACIITQAETVLTAKEYDMILHGKQHKRNLIAANSISFEDKGVNTLISMKPGTHMWPSSYSSTRDQNFADTNTTIQETHENAGPCLVLAKSIDEVQTGSVNDGNDETRVHSSWDSRSPSATSTDSPIGPSQDSTHQLDNSQRGTKRKWHCGHCNKFLLCRSAYEIHERTHTGVKPFQCTVCGRCFGNLGNLNQHMQIHSDVKPHVCHVCGQGFSRSNRLRHHMTSHQYEAQMQDGDALTSGVPSMMGGTVGELNPHTYGNTFDESVTSDDNQ